MEHIKFNVGDRVASLVKVAGSVEVGSKGTVILVQRDDCIWCSVIFDQETNKASESWKDAPPNTHYEAYLYGAWDMRQIELEKIDEI